METAGALMNHRVWKFVIAAGLLFAPAVWAETLPFEIGGETVPLERAENSAGAFLRAFRPNFATGRWDVDVIVTNGSARILRAPIVLRFDAAEQIAPGIVGAILDAGGKPFLNLTPRLAGGQLAPGEALPSFTISMGTVQIRPTLVAGIYALPQTAAIPLAALRTLAGDGTPMEDVAVTEIGPSTPKSFVSGRGGWVSLEVLPGVLGWRFSAPGKISVVRLTSGVGVGRVTELPSPRLVSISDQGPTVFRAETIPAPVPAGWSPLAAALLPVGTANLELNETLEIGAAALLAKWDEPALVWRGLRTINGTGSATIPVETTEPGIFAVLRADVLPVAPPLPGVNAVVPGVFPGSVPTNLTAAGSANPVTRTASRDAALVTTEATVVFASSSGALSSGIYVPCEVSEEYLLRDGRRRVLPGYRMILVGYQRPAGAAGTVSARFAMRPFQLLGGEELSETIVRVQVLKPGAFDGGVFEVNGGILNNGTTRVTAANGDFAVAEAAILQEITLPTNGVAPSGLEALRAFELSAGAAQSGRRLSIDFGPPGPGTNYVLARAIFDEGRHGFQPVQRFSKGADGVLNSSEPSDGLVGVDGGGQFVLFKTTAAEAVISGVARDSSGVARKGLMVKRGPWTAFSDASGAFRLLAPAGNGEASVIDPATGDSGRTAIEVASNLEPVQTALDSAPSGPRIVGVSPRNGATNVSRVSPIAISFNKALNPVTVAGAGVQLLNSTNAVISGSVTLNLAGTVATILPATQLAAAENYRVRVAATVSDLLGRAVEGDREFTFSTAAEATVRGLAGQITIYEPGATNLTPQILEKIPAYDPSRDHDGIVVEASQGTAEPRQKVILVNESTGETATILAEADGSFVTTIRGSVEDFVSAVMVNANETRNQIPATRQRFDDGSVGLFETGGTISSQGEGTPVDFIVEPGAIKGKTVFKVESITGTAFQEAVGGNAPAGAGAPLGAFELTESGDPLQVAADISVPVKLADLGLAPGSDPTNFAFVVTTPVLVDGKILHQVVDTAAYEATGPEGGRLRTQSPPFVGMLARKLAGLADSAGLTTVSPVRIATHSDDPHKGLTMLFGIFPIQSLQAEKVSGSAKAVRANEDGSESFTLLPGAVVRAIRLEDEDDPGNNGILFEGDLVSISDERGKFGFFFKPSLGSITRQLVATHARFPFQKARSGPFVGDRTGATVVSAELRFKELPPALATSDGLGRPEVTVGHDPALPAAGEFATAGATVFVTAVDDKSVGDPTLVKVRVENLQGAELAISEATVTALSSNADSPARKIRQFRVTMKQPGRVILKASASDNQTAPRELQHAISFGVTRPPVSPGDPADIAALRVVFSWPPSGGTNAPALTPITLRFNRALPTEILQPAQLDWLTFGSGHFVRRVTPTLDRKEITIFYDGPTTNEVKLTVGPGITGESGRSFDQNSGEDGAQAFEVRFKQSAGVETVFAGESGAGVLMLGRFAYQLERVAGSSGFLKVLDFAEPGAPEEVQEIRIGYPTAMSLIPGYSMPGATGPCSTQNFLAVFSGTVNEPKFLQLGRIEDGRVTFGTKLVLSGGGTDGSGRRSVASDSTITESISQIVKSKWDAPYLGYFELGADITTIKLINIASFQQVALKNGILETFAIDGGADGVDANGDGDFCDPGDQLPTPDGHPLMTPGMAFSFAPTNRAERIEDFDFHSGLGVGFTVSRYLNGTQKPRLTTFLGGGDTNDLGNAFVEFTTQDTPRRLLFLPAVNLETPTNRVVRDIALVTLSQASGDGALAVVDVTIPSAPVLLNRFSVPVGEGTPSGIVQRDDGLLAVATSRGTLLVDPEKLAASNLGTTHPSMVGRVPLPGTGVRDFVADASGLNLTHGGGVRKFVETAPQFSFVRFNAVVNPNVIADQPESITAGFLKSATPIQIGEITMGPNGATVPSAPDPTRHYYVLADMPGGAADDNEKIKLALSAVDLNGLPQADVGGTVVPAVVGDEQLQSALLSRRLIDLLFSVTKIKKAAGEISQAAGVIAKVRTALGSAKTAKKGIDRLVGLARALLLMPEKIEARRLSNDPDSPLYNKFLAGPFVILGGAPSVEDILALKQQADTLGIERAYLRPSPRLWVGLPSERVGGLMQQINPFTPPASKLRPFVSELRLNPTIQVNGVTVPFSGDIINQLANINTSPANPLTSFFDLEEQITLIVSLLNNAPFVSMVLRGEWQPILVPGAHELLRVNYTDRPMIFVPGFAGSTLQTQGGAGWLGLPGALREGERDRVSLRVSPNGSPLTNTWATDAVRYVIDTPVITAESIYGDWLGHLTGEMGMVEYNFQRRSNPISAPSGETIRARLRMTDGAPLLSQAPLPNLYVFPYDWRLDNQKSAEQLREYVRVALEMHPDADGIDLVAHSNGGLVSRAYMLLPGQSALVKRFITVGTPWLGSPKPLSGLRTGDINETSINLLAPVAAVRAMLQFSPGAHQLLPSKEYFDLGFRPFVEDGFDVNTNGLPNEVYTFEGYMESLAKHFLRKPVEEMGINFDSLGEHPVRANANGFRIGKKIGDHSQDQNNVETHHIVGMGATADTIGQIRVRARLVSQTNTTNVTISLARVGTRETEQVRDGPDALISGGDGSLAVSETNQFRMNEEIEVRYVSGDGTVPIGSLVRGYGSSMNLNAPQAKIHALVSGYGDKITGHNPMLNEDKFLDLFDDIYTGQPVKEVKVDISANSLSEGSLGTINVTGLPLTGDSGTSMSYVIDFGDGSVELKNGTSFESTQAQHRYRQSGSYMITVGAATESGHCGVSSLRVTVANQAPQVTIAGGDFSANVGDSRALVASVSDPGLDDRHSFLWTLPGGGAAGLNQFAVPVTFNEPGQHTVSVKVTDTDGGEGQASITVTVLGTTSTTGGPNFGSDPAAANSGLASAPIVGFDGGHPEIIVRVHGHSTNSLGTVGLAVKQTIDTDIFSDTLLGGLFDFFIETSGPVDSLLERAILPRIARFLGLLGKETEYARLVRELPNEVLSIDVAAKRAIAAARGKGGPIEVDVLYLEGGAPKVLHRWKVPTVATNEGVRMRFDWVLLDAQLERVQLDSATPMTGSFLETVPALFRGFGEQKAADRSGPATLGILNPATDTVRILARDNLTVETNISKFAVFDANENGRFDDDVFYPLDTNVVKFARLPKRPFAIVGVDEQGNVGGLDPFTLAETRNFLVDKGEGESLSEYEKKLNDIRAAVRGAIQDGLSSSVIVGKYLLRSDHLWVFEQGSGANLWKPNSVQRCNGIYIPGKSDNDYELFFPVKLENEYVFDAAGRARFLADGPYEPGTLTGDWYFKRPQGINASGNPTEEDGAIVTWEFVLPAGFLVDGQPTFRVPRADNDDNLGAGFKSPLTPAELIARVFTKAITDNHLRRPLIPDTTFFPERREHFMFGQLHLERPPEFGDDPIGDAGTGRQLLLLKWLMEGAFVTATDGGSVNDLSPGAPSLANIFTNWKQTGVPLAEGFEWGVFQDFAALKSRPFQVVSIRLSQQGATDSPRLVNRYYDDAARAQQASRLKKLGKSAIRATLARLAGDTNLNSLVANVSEAQVITSPARSYEDFILGLARGNAQAKAAFGDFANDRDDVDQPPDIGDFLRAKKADRAYLETILTTPGAYERFVTSTFQFLRQIVQAPTRPAYTNYMEDLRQGGETSELSQRTENLNLVVRGRGSSQPGLLALNTDRRISRLAVPRAVEVYSPGGVGQIQISSDDSDGNPPAPAPLQSKKKPKFAATPSDATIIDGAPDEDETTNDGATTTEGVAILEGTGEETTVLREITALSGSAVESAMPDNTTVVEAKAIESAIAPPAISGEPITIVSVRPFGAADLFLLDDWPATETRPRSARFLIRHNDDLILDVLSKEGLSPYTATVTTESDPDGRQVILEDPLNAGVYSTRGTNIIHFTPNSNDPDPDLIYVKDEEIVRIRFSGNGFDHEESYMIDLGELSIAGLQFLDRDPLNRARFDYIDGFLNPAFPGSFDFFDRGTVLYPDNVAAAVNGGPNDMRDHIQKFADPFFAPGSGESDFLYVNSHGSSSGNLFDHIVNNAPAGAREVIVDPVGDIALFGHWRTDAEWAILHMCNALSPVASGITGRQTWQVALTNLNGAPDRRMPHGILGFRDPVGTRRPAHQRFMAFLQIGVPIVEAWREAMTVSRLPWATLAFASAEKDTIRQMTQDPFAGDAVNYRETTGAFDVVSCEDSESSESLLLSSAAEILKLPGTFSADLPAVEKIFRAMGYEPAQMRLVGLSEETEGLLYETGRSEPRQVAKIFHWELGEAEIALRIDEHGNARVFDSRRIENLEAAR